MCVPQRQELYFNRNRLLIALIFSAIPSFYHRAFLFFYAKTQKYFHQQHSRLLTCLIASTTNSSYWYFLLYCKFTYPKESHFKTASDNFVALNYISSYRETTFNLALSQLSCSTGIADDSLPRPLKTHFHIHFRHSVSSWSPGQKMFNKIGRILCWNSSHFISGGWKREITN